MAEGQDLNLTFSGCGFLGVYHLGVISCLRENAPALLNRVKCYGGASAGAIAAAALALDINVSETSEFVVRVVKKANSLTLGTLHPSFSPVRILRKTFRKVIPKDAHERLRGRLHISLTRVSDMKNVVMSDFQSKEELIEALLASSFVPFWSGIVPLKVRGKYYVDGGISDNLPQHFMGETITVSPFSGETDICPKDSSSNDVHFDFKNNSMQITLQNLYRISRALFPPKEDVLFDMSKNGYRDTLHFLKTHYPDMLKKKTVQRPSLSQYLSPFSAESASSHSSLSNSENDDIKTEEDGESRLVLILYHTSEGMTEAELWSCYFIRRIYWVLKLAAKPCVISLGKISQLANIILQSLPKVKKTGNNFLDELLAMIYMVIHTYQDKHQVQCQSQFTPALMDKPQYKDESEMVSSPQELTPRSATVDYSRFETIEEVNTSHPEKSTPDVLSTSDAKDLIEIADWEQASLVASL